MGGMLSILQVAGSFQTGVVMPDTTLMLESVHLQLRALVAP